MSNQTPLPTNAKCVFRGILFEVYQWEQEMYDGSFQTFERLKRPDTSIVLPIVGDRILIMSQQQPGKPQAFLSIPGGRVDAGEDPLAAAKRELLEETGYASTDWQLWKELNPVGKIVWTVRAYIARNCTYVQPQQLDNGEKIETRFVTFDELLGLSDDPIFYERELNETLVRCRFIPEEREKFHQLLFSE